MYCLICELREHRSCVNLQVWKNIKALKRKMCDFALVLGLSFGYSRWLLVLVVLDEVYTEILVKEISITLFCSS